MRTPKVTVLNTFSNESIVASASGERFDQTLRRAPYPFCGAGLRRAVSVKALDPRPFPSDDGQAQFYDPPRLGLDV